MAGAGSGITVSGDGGDNTIGGSPLDDTLAGNGGNDTLSGLAGNDLLTGGAGVDITDGGAGDDWFFVDNAGDRIVEADGGGNDRLFASASYVLGAGVSVEMLTTSWHAGTAAIDLTGNELVNILCGNAGNNVLDGGGGADILVGWAGDDWYSVDNAGDRVVEAAGEGQDRVFASASYRLAAGAAVEQLSTTEDAGTGAIDLTGNELANSIFGNAGHNALNGGGGADMLAGRAGDDWYFVDDAGDRVGEAVGEGNDRLFASVSYTLAAGAAVESMSTDNHAGTAAIDLTGNELANSIYGNAGANVLDGGAGADTLVGWAGDDTLRGGGDSDRLLGGDGDDALDGGGGVDTMIGGQGNDTYYVDYVDYTYTDHRFHDNVIEAAGEGRDTIVLTNLAVAAVGYQLPYDQDVEDLRVIESTYASKLYGNGLDNILYGNSGDNYMSGGVGDDVLYGFGGNDRLVWGATGHDTLIGGTGDDIYQTVPNDTVIEAPGEGSDTWIILGGAGANFVLPAGLEIEFLRPESYDEQSFYRFDIAGNEFGQTLSGSFGDNVLDGKGGNDVLTGRSGDDVFVFSTALGPGNIDTITDFSSHDRIRLDSAVFQGLTPGSLPAEAFRVGAEALDADDRILFDPATHVLWFDEDGSATAHTAIQFATLSWDAGAAAASFIVI